MSKWQQRPYSRVNVLRCILEGHRTELDITEKLGREQHEVGSVLRTFRLQGYVYRSGGRYRLTTEGEQHLRFLESELAAFRLSSAFVRSMRVRQPAAAL